MKMDTKVPDVPMLEMTHGIVEINMIQQLAHQDGLATNRLENVLWPTQEMDSEVNQPAKTSANQTQVDKLNTDATLPATNAKLAKMEILDVILTEPVLVETARMAQIQLNFSSATRLTQNNQNARCVTRRTQLVAPKEVKPVNHAHQRKSFSNVTRRL